MARHSMRLTDKRRRLGFAAGWAAANWLGGAYRIGGGGAIG